MCEIIKRKLNVEVSRNLRVFEVWTGSANVVCYIEIRPRWNYTECNKRKRKKTFSGTFHFVASLSEVVQCCLISVYICVLRFFFYSCEVDKTSWNNRKLQICGKWYSSAVCTHWNNTTSASWIEKKSFTQKGAIIMLIRTNTMKSKDHDEEGYYHPFLYCANVLSISLYFDSKEPDFIVIFKCS